jgi:hypothetical protein
MTVQEVDSDVTLEALLVAVLSTRTAPARMERVVLDAIGQLPPALAAVAAEWAALGVRPGGWRFGPGREPADVLAARRVYEEWHCAMGEIHARLVRARLPVRLAPFTLPALPWSEASGGSSSAES